MAYVSDHAVLRYIERVMLIDVESIRAKLNSPVIDTAMQFGWDTVLMDDCRLKLKGDLVATVLEKRSKR